MTPCRHCHRQRSCKARGLCWRCTHTPAIVALYPIKQCAANRRGVGNDTGGFVLPARPTTTLPGTRAHHRLLARRAARGEALFHPQDAMRDLS